MKNYISNLFYFLTCFILLNYLLYELVSKPALYENYFANEKSIDNYNLVLVGDSHGSYLENATNEFGIFNLSYSGDNYLDMYLKIKYFSKFLSNKDTILLSVDNHHLSSYRDGPANIRKNVIYSDNISELESSYFTKKEYFIKKQLKFLPLLNPEISRLLLKYIYFSLGLEKNDYDTTNSFKEIDNITRNKKCYVRFKAQFENKNKSYQQVKYLNKIINLCKKNDLTLIGVKFPITKEYWKLINNNDFGIMELLIENKIKIIDLHNLFFYKNKYFKDQDHLNRLGGEFFLKKLKKEI